MKKPSSSPTVPRILSVAARIVDVQSRRTAIHDRKSKLLGEIAELNEEESLLLAETATLQRDLDRLSAGPTVVK